MDLIDALSYALWCSADVQRHVYFEITVRIQSGPIQLVSFTVPYPRSVNKHIATVGEAGGVGTVPLALKGLVEKVHTFDTRGHTVPLLRRYDRSRAHRDRDIVWL